METWTQPERRSPESRAARAIVAARKEVEHAERLLECLQGSSPPAAVRKRRQVVAERLAAAQEQERQALELLGANAALH
jgi:outer membrane PBP1 activator LpoA protein